MRTLTIILAVAVLALICGCEGGLPLMSQANPQTTITVDPVSKQIRIFTNDGRAFTTKDISINWKTRDGGTGEFRAAELGVTERSVENRQANVLQMEAGARQIEATGNAISNVVGAVVTPMRGATLSASGEGPLGKAAADVKLGDQIYVPIVLPPTSVGAPPPVLMVPKAPAIAASQPAKEEPASKPMEPD
jgi:hypothetical protein